MVWFLFYLKQLFVYLMRPHPMKSRTATHRAGKRATDFEAVARRLHYKSYGRRTYNLYTGGYARA